MAFGGWFKMLLRYATTLSVLLIFGAAKRIHLSENLSCKKLFYVVKQSWDHQKETANYNTISNQKNEKRKLQQDKA
ncbi:MAG: hypothetical protein WAN47_04855 [Nitrosotalea sp.]